MYYHHGSSGQSTSGASKLHDGPGVNGSDPRQSGWGRHPSFQPSNALPLPSSSGFPPNDPRMLGFPPPHHANHSHQPHHPNQQHHLNNHHAHNNHAHVGHHVTGSHQHHPSFGSGVGGLHLGGQGGMFGQNGSGGFGGMGGFGAVGNGQGSPPRGGRDDMPMTAFWQQQLLRAEVSISSST